MASRTLRAQLAEELHARSDAGTLASDMFAAIIVHDDEPCTARRAVLGDMAGALILHTNRLALSALGRGRIGVCCRLARLDNVLTAFIIDLAHADIDPAADMLRVSLLQLQLSAVASSEGPGLKEAAAAMARVAAAGTLLVS